MIAGSSISWLMILILPLDVANSRGDGGGLNMEVLYKILFILWLVWLVVIIPMTILLYESDEDKNIFARIFGTI